MHRLIRSLVVLLLLWQPSKLMHAQWPGNSIDLTVMYSELRANAPVGGCGCFWMAGGTGELSFPVWRNFSAVMEAGGQHTGNIPGANVGLSLVTGMGGLRRRFPTRTKFQPFGQALFGGVHGFDSYFPAPVGKLPTTYDTSFAMAIGGGVDVAVSRHVWLRILQADYYYSELRNVQGDRQNQFRLGAGIVFRGAGGK
jgi:outer membrane immunogenic protein